MPSAVGRVRGQGGSHRLPLEDRLAPPPGAGPPAALAALFCAVLFVFPSEVVLAGPLKSNGSPGRLIGFVALLLVALGLVRGRGRLQVHHRVDPVVVLVLLFLAQALFSYGVETGRTLNATAAATSLRYVLVLTAGVGIALLIAVAVRDLTGARRLLGWLVAGSVLNAGVGLVQAMGATLSWADVVRVPGMAFTSNPGQLRERLDFVRVLGTTSHPIEFAVCLAVTLPLAIHLSRFAGTPGRRVASAAAAGVIALATPFALSRSGLLCIAVGLLLYVPFATRAQRWAVLAGAVLAPALAVVAVPRVVDAFVELFNGVATDSAAADDSISGRLADYVGVQEVFDRSPWLGGVLTSGDGVLDNQWLGFLVRGGLVSVVGFAALLLGPVTCNVIAARLDPRDPERSSLAGALVAGLVASGVAAYTFDTLAFQQSALLVFVLVGLTSVVVRSTWTTTPPPARPPTSTRPIVHTTETEEQ
ncbi:putative O-antigen polymerase [Modestobacter italicus]|uniref:O-antigen polymerase n=1 Tax=Modestobacter italicus (strain DSM 44449 / CECT 9708 / BC 501) TaxID=2732864 RepID=I4ERA0_MODI5|nr:O-antigen ligase family protein [Modestobacter marinus]CCH85913.1 putative O-antigen polymerase [Modestobacter marinus]